MAGRKAAPITRLNAEETARLLHEMDRRILRTINNLIGSGVIVGGATQYLLNDSTGQPLLQVDGTKILVG